VNWVPKSDLLSCSLEFASCKALQLLKQNHARNLRRGWPQVSAEPKGTLVVQEGKCKSFGVLGKDILLS
jgi:hypothetical protein